jgi:predicted transcriptional regulator
MKKKNDSVVLGEAIKQARGVESQSKLAYRVRLHSSSISKYETGHHRPTQKTWKKLVQALPDLKKVNPTLLTRNPRGPNSMYGIEPKSGIKMTSKVMKKSSDKPSKKTRKVKKAEKPIPEIKTASVVSMTLIRSMKNMDLNHARALLEAAKQEKLDLDMLLDLIEVFQK